MKEEKLLNRQKKKSVTIDSRFKKLMSSKILKATDQNSNKFKYSHGTTYLTCQKLTSPCYCSWKHNF